MNTFFSFIQKRATSGLIKLVALFPSTTLFFLNTWTWGYEDILKAIFTAFRSKVQNVEPAFEFSLVH